MASRLIHSDRIGRLREGDPRPGPYTLYWMNQSQRSESNDALEFSIRRANERKEPLLVAFAIDSDSFGGQHRQLQFLLEGLAQVESSLDQRGIRMVVRKGSPRDIIPTLAADASELITDRGYLRHQRGWARDIASSVECPVWQVEADAIIPVEIASNKREYAARTIRSQLNDQVNDFLTELDTTPIDSNETHLEIHGEDLSDLHALAKSLQPRKDAGPVSRWSGGTSQAKAKLREFIDNELDQYDQRKDILQPHVSYLSPYLHFGQISPRDVYRVIASATASDESRASFLEELLVRRELALNFVFFTPDYDSLQCLPDWASETLREHESDTRDQHYTLSALEHSETDDEAWNAAMKQMRETGYLHNYLRMYWGKKILQWTNTVSHAYHVALTLNNRYFLDGNDCNSFANVGWLFGLHDRPHQERPIFGKVRYLSRGGLERKFDVAAYIDEVLQPED